MTASCLIPTINGNLYSSLECAVDKDLEAALRDGAAWGQVPGSPITLTDSA